MRLLALSCVLLLTFVLAGCSSSPSSPSSSNSSSGAMAGMMMAKTAHVALQGNKFVNDTVTIYEGDTVEWTNKDNVGHSVTSSSGDSFDNKPNCSVAVLPPPECMGNGENFSHTFTKAGTTEYYCRAHSNMKGKVIVLPHSAMANMTMSGSMSMSHSSTSSAPSPA